MSRYAIALLGAAMLAAPVSAQTATDASTDQNWSGPYVGVHGGYGFDADRSVRLEGTDLSAALAPGAGVRPDRLNTSRNGFLGGAQVGYNMQSGRFVYGGEADFSWLGAKGSDTFRNPTAVGAQPAGQRSFTNHQLDWLGTVRAKAGYSFGDGYFYLTGGYAYGKVKGQAEFNAPGDTAVTYAGGHNYNASGWTAGGGLEFRPFGSEGFMRNASIKAETLYYDLGRSHIQATSTTAGPGAYTLGFDTRGYVSRVGLNFAF